MDTSIVADVCCDILYVTCGARIWWQLVEISMCPKGNTSLHIVGPNRLKTRCANVVEEEVGLSAHLYKNNVL